MHKKRMILFFMSVSIGLMPIQAFAAEQLTKSYQKRQRTFQIFRNLMKLLFQTILAVLFRKIGILEFHYVYGCFRKNVFQYPVHGDYYRSDQFG